MDSLKHLNQKAGSQDPLCSVEQTAERLSKAGRWSELADFLGGLQASEHRERPEFVLLRAEADLRLGNLHQAVALANKVLADGNLAHNLKVKAYLVRSSACRLRGFLQAAIEDASTALALLQDASTPLELRIECHRQLGAALTTGGDLDAAAMQLQQGLRLCSRSCDLGLLATIQDNLAVTLAQLGQLSGALVYFERAKAAYQKLKNTTDLARVLNNIGRLFYDLGQYDASLRALREALVGARQIESKRLEATILVSIGDTLKQMDDCEEALNAYREAQKPADEALEPRVSCYANIGTGTTYCCLGEFDKARLLLGEGAYEAERLGLKHELAIATLTLGIVDLKQRQYKEAAARIVKATTQLEEIGSKRELLKGHLHLALVYLQTGRWARLHRCLKGVATITRELDLKELLVLEAKTTPEVVAYAASKRLCGGLFREVQDRLQGRPDPKKGDVPAGISSASRQTPLPLIEAFGFGTSSVSIDGRRVTEAEWGSRKAKELFMYLLCHRRGAGREELIEILWPETSASLSRNAFYNNVYRVRKALYEECIVQEDKRYCVNPGGSFWFDMGEFEKLVNRAAKLPRGSEERAACLEQAIRLYRGSFLEDFYAEWCDTIRFQVEAQYLRSLASLAGFHAARGEYEQAINLLQQLLTVDEINQGAHEQIIAILLRQGEIAAASHRYRQYQALLKEQIGVEPSKDFKQMCVEAGVVS